MRLVVLGSGTSFGVPVIGCTCRVCQSDDPRDRRMRAGALVEVDDERHLLIDTPPELRLQLLGAGVGQVEAVLYTHDHADHLHGIDDLRAVSVRRGRLPLCGPPDVLERIRQRFSYIFDPHVVPPRGTSKPELAPTPLAPGRWVSVAGTEVLPVAVEHGAMTVYGYRIGGLGYVTDVKAISDQAVDALRGVRVLVLSALLERPHPTHLSIPEAVEVARAEGARQTYLTHRTHTFSHAELSRRLPEGVDPAYDGLTAAF